MLERELGSKALEARGEHTLKLNNNKEVFEKISKSYMREDSHWGSDLDVIKTSLDELIKKESNIRWLDIGCGTGFHLTNIAELYPEIKAIGIEYSPLMLGQAKKRIENLGLQNISLEEKDIIKDPIKNKYNLITFLNNGFGNLYRDGTDPEKIRNKTIQAINNSLNKNGYFVLSVYNKEKLDTNYGSNLKLLENRSNLSKGYMFVKYTPKNSEPVVYYSHWFSEKELRGLTVESSLKMDFLERRMSRFLARYKKL